jgi:serine/threonine-protein kinase RsbT
MKMPNSKKITMKRTKSAKQKRVFRNNRTCLISDEADIEEAVRCTMLIAGRIGFRESSSCMIGTAVSELARNIHRYAKTGGAIHISELRRGRTSGIQIVATDNGPGIKDIRKAMQDNYSTTTGSLGIGLSGVKRFMDEFKIKSGKGTTVMVRKWAK